MSATTATKERPILFSASMIRAILDGQKTQTRRITKEFDGFQDMDKLLARFPNQQGCPYGKPGDRLWVRETWAAAHDFDAFSPREIPKGTRIYYSATADLKGPFGVGGLRCRPSIFMPRWASRINLEITAIRVERLQSISDADALAEGCSADDMKHGDSLSGVYARLWQSIHGPGSWNANPWVWVVEFRRVQP
jgi:hypothetical protein